MGIIEAKDFESVSPFFRGERGHRRAGLFMKMFAIDKVNRLCDHSIGYTGAGFAARLLNDLGVDYLIGNAGRLEQLPEGAFITVSNHPYGGLDGIILIDLFAGIRPDYKFMVNRILSFVTAMRENFILVRPTGNKQNGISGTSINGIRGTMSRLQDGHPVGFFPSGAVSDFSLKDMRVRDRKWQASILHLIHSARVPVLPVRFFDNNSAFFYFLGLINWRVRLLRMPSELFNKKGRVSRIGVGNMISAQEQERFTDTRSFGTFLRKAVYEMPEPHTYIRRSDFRIPEKPDNWGN